MTKLNVQKETPEVKEIELDILEKENGSFIVRVDGWRMRVYFEEGFEQTSGKINVKYTGDINDVHSIRFEKLK